MCLQLDFIVSKKHASQRVDSKVLYCQSVLYASTNNRNNQTNRLLASPPRPLKSPFRGAHFEKWWSVAGVYTTFYGSAAGCTRLVDLMSLMLSSIVPAASVALS